jgi:hypothetical protein
MQQLYKASCLKKECMHRFINKNSAGVVCLISVAGIIYAATKIIPQGIAGNIANTKPYLVMVAVLFAIAIPAAFIYQMYVNRGPIEDEELERMRIEMDTLSKVGSQLQDGKQPSSRHGHHGSTKTDKGKPTE